MLLCRVDMYISILAVYKVGRPVASFIQVCLKAVYIMMNHPSAEIKRVSYNFNLLKSYYTICLAPRLLWPPVTVGAHHSCY
jgi:hypothetical protein